VTAGAVSATLSSIAATPTSINSAGETSTITVTARDQFGNLIQGLLVELAATGTGNTVTQPVAATNASGVATGTLSSLVTEVKTVSATIGGVLIVPTVDVTVTLVEDLADAGVVASGSARTFARVTRTPVPYVTVVRDGGP